MSNITETTMVETNGDFFDNDYVMWPIWLGLDWLAISFIPIIAFYLVRPWLRSYDYLGTSFHYDFGLTTGEAFAWYTTMWVNGSAFWVLAIFWGLSYLQLGEDRVMQKLYYRAIAWIIPISWLLLFMQLIGFIVGGTQSGVDVLGNGVTFGKNLGPDIGYAIGFLIVIGGLEAVAWYLANGTIKFYKWDKQEWWTEDAEQPENWPDQLGLEDTW